MYFESNMSSMRVDQYTECSAHSAHSNATVFCALLRCCPFVYIHGAFSLPNLAVRFKPWLIDPIPNNCFTSLIVRPMSEESVVDSWNACDYLLGFGPVLELTCFICLTRFDTIPNRFIDRYRELRLVRPRLRPHSGPFRPAVHGPDVVRLSLRRDLP